MKIIWLGREEVLILKRQHLTYLGVKCQIWEKRDEYNILEPVEDLGYSLYFHLVFFVLHNHFQQLGENVEWELNDRLQNNAERKLRISENAT